MAQWNFNCPDCIYYKPLEVCPFTACQFTPVQTAPTIDAVPVDARQLALKTKVCQMCEDCPGGCPVETPKAGIVTNANRIRNMSDEELAEYIFDLGNGSEYCYGHCAYQDDCDTNIGLDHDTCIKGVIEWLKQPAKEV